MFELHRDAEGNRSSSVELYSVNADGQPLFRVTFEHDGNAVMTHTNLEWEWVMKFSLAWVLGEE